MFTMQFDAVSIDPNNISKSSSRFYDFPAHVFLTLFIALGLNFLQCSFSKKHMT